MSRPSMYQLEDRTTPATLYAVDATNNLLRFDSATPGTIDQNTLITGLTAGQSIVGIDFRPATGELYALGQNATNTFGQLYTVNRMTAVATAVGSGFAIPQATGALSSGIVGFDFNPTVDRIRITNAASDNFRVNPDTGALVAADTALSSSNISGVSYSNNVGTATSTTLYALNSGGNSLSTIGGVNGTPSPNGGSVMLVGSLGVVTTSSNNYLSIEGDNGPGNNNTAWAALDVTDTGLYEIDLATGAATLVGKIGSGADLVGFTVQQPNALKIAGGAGADSLVIAAMGADSGIYQFFTNGALVRQVVFSGVTSVNFIGGAGDDTMTIFNPANSLFAPVDGIFFDGQSQTSPTSGDTLRNLGGGSASFFASYVATGADSGFMTSSDGVITQAITFAGLEPVTDTSAAATFNIDATTASETLNIVNGPAEMGLPTTQVNSGATPTFELINFANKTAVTISALAGDDTITINNPVPGNGLKTLTVDSEDGLDVVNVLATATGVDTTVSSTNGAGTTDVITIGSGGSVQSILGTLNIQNTFGFSNVTLDNSADTIARTVTVSSSQITGLAPGAINFTAFSIDTLKISGGSGGNTYNVNGSPQGPPGNTTINGGSGDDTFNIVGNTLGDSSVNNFNGEGGSDSFNVNTMPLMGVTLNVDGGAGNGSDVLSLSNDTFTSETITATGPGAGTIVFDFLLPITFTGLEPINDTVAAGTLTINATAAAEEINVIDGPTVLGFATTQVNSGASNTFELVNFANKPTVIINALDGVDTITVDNPNPGTGLTALTVDSGDGNDLVSVRSTPASVATTLSSSVGAGTTDDVSIGKSGSVQEILGAVTVDNVPGFSTLSIDDSADGKGKMVTLNLGSLTGLAPAAISWTDGDLDTLNVAGGTGGNTFIVTKTQAGTPGTTNINSGSGSDTFNIDGSGLGAMSVNNFNGQAGADSFNVESAPPADAQLNIDGGADTDTLTGPASVNVWNLTAANAGNITGIVTAFSSVEQLVGGPSADTLVGLNAASTWNITGPDAGNITGAISSFTGMENLTGGSDADQFVFANGTANVTGVVDGGGGTDGLDYSALNTDVSANLGISTTNAAALNGAQVVPANSSTATGTATFTFNAANRTFDINLTVTGVAAADAQLAIQLQLGIAGANGANIITLFSTPGSINLGMLTPTADGFTFTAAGVALPGASEAAFLGDGTYLDILSAAFPGGEIRGQVIRQTQSASATGTATGTGSITNLENVTGGSGADSLVGSSSANTLIGNAGNDTMLGGQGADQFTGGDNNDVMIWANGDGSDVMDGGAGTDTVRVNGSVTAGDAFLVQPGAGGRLAFQRTNLGTFSLDIGTTENLTVNGGIGSDTFTVNSLTGVLDLTSANLNGAADADTFNVTAASSVTLNVDGDLPAPPASPGDTLVVTTTGATGALLSFTSSANGLNGAYTFSNRQPVNFQRVETLSPDGTDLSITVTDNVTSAVPGKTVTYTIVVTNNGPLAATGAKVANAFPGILSGITFTAVQSGGVTGFTANGAGNINDTVNMPVGSTITYTVTATISASATGNLTNTATVAAQVDQPDPNLANNTSTDTTPLTPQADLQVTITDNPDPVMSGSNITYTITVLSNGPSDATMLQLLNAVPANTTFVSFTAPAGWTPNTPAVGGTGNVTATRTTLTVGDGAQVFTLVVKVNVGTPNNTIITDTVTVSSTTTDLVGGNNSAMTTTTVTASALPIISGAGAGGTPRVQVIDPATGAVTFDFLAYEAQFPGGVRVAAGDVTGDGVPDILTGAGPGGGPHAKVFDGVTGAEVRSFFAYDAAFRGGLFIGAGDINDDGFADIITGADAGGGPHVIVWSGKDLAILTSFYAYDSAFTGGVRVTGGDVNGDGRDDIITGAGPGGGPQVIAYSGANLDILRSFYAYDSAFTGGVYVAAGDLNDDGFADIVTGAGAGGTSHVIAYSGKSGDILHSFLAFDAAFSGGVTVGIVDFGADNQLDIAAGAGAGGVPVVSLFNGDNQDNVNNFFAFDPSFMGGVFVG